MYDLKEQEGKALDLKVYVHQSLHNMNTWISWWTPRNCEVVKYPNGDIIFFETKELVQEYAELMLKL